MTKLTGARRSHPAIATAVVLLVGFAVTACDPPLSDQLGAGGGVEAPAAPEPAPDPDPAPDPEPAPTPAPLPLPAPDQEPAPTPEPDPAAPDPEPSPDPEPTPGPEPAPAPAPRPEPAPTPAPAPAGLNQAEQLIYQWTNELRADPAGPWARAGGVPAECRDSLPTDPSTGQPRPQPPLTINEAASIQIARAWSQQLASEGYGSLHHRPDIGSDGLRDLGIQNRGVGENVAWQAGPGDDDAARARILFTGWIESAGHYCNMMSPTRTGIAVGYVRDGNSSWGTQNFWR